MQKIMLLCGGLAILLIGCVTSWQYEQLEEFEVIESVPEAQSCQHCHQKEYETWMHTKHGDTRKMEKIPVVQMRECAACHDVVDKHIKNPVQHTPPAFSELSKARQNIACGKCHYNPELFGRKAISPHNWHGLFMSVGFEDKKRLISCLDCHTGHGEKSKMLRRLRAHTCFTCHKEAILTMGVFQPLNYLAVGKLCFSCHPQHGGSTVEQVARIGAVTGASCIACHPTGL